MQDSKQLKLDLEKNKFPANVVEPVYLGIARGKMQKEKLQRLIDLGANVRSKTVQSRVQVWKRQVKRLESSIARLQELKQEIEASRLKLAGPAETGQARPHRRLRFE